MAADNLLTAIVEIARAGAPKPRRHYVLPVGECKYSDEHRDEQMMPPHDASPRCESGKHPHCSCDTCF